MKPVVVYCSQTGHTERYARWLAEELGCEAIPLSNRNTVRIDDFDTVIFGSWFHAASIPGSKWLKQQIAAHPDKRFVLFATGASPMPEQGGSAEEIEEAFRRTFPSSEYPDLPWFYLRGGFSMEKLGAVDRTLMKLFFKRTSKLAETDPKAAEADADMRAGFDGTDRTYLEPLLTHIRNLSA
ncbi:flavodoxin family protein [Raoultibacter phocaeensis]|uniref:flavodoxin family protein n=1 Tax=Raoultibacter phocaeensis TaxID=2479841 RepID=UPI00111A6249|nr:flavodoxin domain-containing protein [Raoultibacter phocaeensis]